MSYSPWAGGVFLQTRAKVAFFCLILKQQAGICAKDAV